MNRLFLIIMLLVSSPAPSLAVETIHGEFQAVVTWVIDGDSIRFRRIGSEKEDECRMLHYNAPEMTGRERPEGRKTAKKLIGLIRNRSILVWGLERDRYGRLLCEVRLMDGTYINHIMRDFLKDYKRRDIYIWKEKGQKHRGDK